MTGLLAFYLAERRTPVAKSKPYIGSHDPHQSMDDSTWSACLVLACRDMADQAAPLALCPKHLRLAFAYVLELERPDLAENADRLPYWAPTATPTGWVYFIRVGDLVKIGYSRSPQQRFYALQPSDVLHLEPGSMADERRCHLAFAHLRVEGELFRPDPELLTFIGDLQRKTAA